MMATGKICVMFAKNTSLYYAGWTKRSIGEQCSEIDKHSPLTLRIISVFFGTKADLAWIHKVLSGFRVRHNWFNLPEHAAWWLVKKSLQYPETPDKLVSFDI